MQVLARSSCKKFTLHHSSICFNHLCDFPAADRALLAITLQFLRTLEAARHVTAWNENRVYRLGHTNTTFVFLLRFFLQLLQLVIFLLHLLFVLELECLEFASDLCKLLLGRLFLLRFFDVRLTLLRLIRHLHLYF